MTMKPAALKEAKALDDALRRLYHMGNQSRGSSFAKNKFFRKGFYDERIAWYHIENLGIKKCGKNAIRDAVVQIILDGGEPHYPWHLNTPLSLALKGRRQLDDDLV